MFISELACCHTLSAEGADEAFEQEGGFLGMLPGQASAAGVASHAQLLLQPLTCTVGTDSPISS